MAASPARLPVPSLAGDCVQGAVGVQVAVDRTASHRAPANVVAALAGDRALDWALDTRAGEAVVAGVRAKLHGVVSAAGGVRRSMPGTWSTAARWDPRRLGARVRAGRPLHRPRRMDLRSGLGFPDQFPGTSTGLSVSVLVEVGRPGPRGSAPSGGPQDLATQRLLTQAELGRARAVTGQSRRHARRSVRPGQRLQEQVESG